MRKSWIYLWLISLSFNHTVLATEHTYYRYTDKEGHSVMSNTLPSEVANDGYEIITSRGNVIERVAPKKTSSEIEQDKAVLEKQQEKAAQKKRQEALQAKKDEILLKSFTNESDIIRSRDEKLASIKILEQITQENIKRLQKQLDEANSQAVQYTQSQQPIPTILEKTISDSKRQIEENQNFLVRKKVEKEEIEKKYRDLVERFNRLNVKTKNN